VFIFQTNISESKALKGNVCRGVGEGSRSVLDPKKLQEFGWEVKRRESSSNGKIKVFFTYISPAGKTYKSSKEVVQILKDEGVL